MVYKVFAMDAMITGQIYGFVFTCITVDCVIDSIHYIT